MRKEIVAISLVLVMLLSFAACAKEPSVQEIIDGVIEAQDDIRSYEFEMDMSWDMAGEVEGEAGEGTIAMELSGALDLENRQMRATIAMDMAMTGEDEMEIEMEMYIIDNMGYMMMEVPEMGPMWMKQEISEADWQQTLTEVIAMSEPQIELLQTAQVEVIGSERVKGVDCYLLQLTPDMEQLWQTAMQQAALALSGGGTGLAEIPEGLLEEAFSDFSVKQWVAKDTYFLMKAEIDMAMELTAEAMEVEEGEMTMNITISLLAYNYNESISIVVPPEALEAQDFLGAGEEEAAETELSNIQAAVYSMMVDNEIASLPNPVAVATDDMSAFPDATSAVAVDKVNDPDGTAYAVGDVDGFLLYQHDITADAAATGLVNYVVVQYTTGTYTVDADGTVTQVTTGFE